MAEAKITDIKLMIVQDQGTPPWNLIRVETDQGVWGLGEAYWGWGLRGIIDGFLKQQLLGENPLDVERLYTKMAFNLGGLHNEGGAVVAAMSGIEIALWDLAGKLTGLPVYRLLGGKFRDRVRMYRTGNPPDGLSLESCKEYASKLLSQGWTAIKSIDVDSLAQRYDPQYKEAGHEPFTRHLTTLDLKRTTQFLENLRLAFGEDFDIAVHCHWSLDLRDAITLAQIIAPYRPIWLEDPLPVSFSPAWVRLTEVSPVPICTGENLYTKHEFRPFIEQHGVDIVQPDIPKVGGLLETRRIADMADTHYMLVCAHNPASIVGTIASAHVAATIRGFGMLERAGEDLDWYEDLVFHNEPFIQGGYVRVPDGPGLGIELNPEVVRAHLAAGERYWE